MAAVGTFEVDGLGSFNSIADWKGVNGGSYEGRLGLACVCACCAGTDESAASLHHFVAVAVAVSIIGKIFID